MSRLEEIKRLWNENNDPCNPEDYEWLIQQAERVEKLENRNKQLEYASMHNGELNEFLQKRKLPPNTLGRHVVDVVMDYVEELEEKFDTAKFIARQNNAYGTNQMKRAERYKQGLEEAREQLKIGEFTFADVAIEKALQDTND